MAVVTKAMLLEQVKELQAQLSELLGKTEKFAAERDDALRSVRKIQSDCDGAIDKQEQLEKRLEAIRIAISVVLRVKYDCDHSIGYCSEASNEPEDVASMEVVRLLRHLYLVANR